MPGIDLAAKSLRSGTAKLPYVNIKTCQTAIGKNTIDAINSGIYIGIIGSIECIVSKILSELDDISLIILTGGPCEIFKNSLSFNKIETKFVPDLTMYGIAILPHKKIQI